MQKENNNYPNDSLSSKPSSSERNSNSEPSLTLPTMLDKFILGECVSTMARLPAQSVDTIFADPPYFLQIEKELKRPNETAVEGVTNAWDRFDSIHDYDNFSEKWLLQAKRLLKDNGTIWVMGSYHNIYRLGRLLQDLGFWILNDIVWVKNNPMPNFHGRRFTNAHEVLLWCAKGKNSKYRFNYRALKKLNGDKQMRSDWRLPICSGKERLRSKDGKSLHPTQKPISLLYRVIVASTKVGDVLLDPFGGTGTSVAMCKMLGRKYIAIEREPEYVKAAQERLEQIAENSSEADAETLFLPEPREQARDIPFAALLENGLLAPGEKLESKCRKFQASITADGDLAHLQSRASIHKLAAQLAGRQSCNGWTYWHYQAQKNVQKKSADKKSADKTLTKPRASSNAIVGEKTRRVPLDELRQALRATLKLAENNRQASKDIAPNKAKARI